MRKWTMLVLASAILMGGCDAKQETGGGNGTNQESTAGVGGGTVEEPIAPGGMPEEMPADFDFSVRYGYGQGNKNEVNTYDGTVTKDLVVKGTAQASLTLSESEMRDIYGRMKAIDIWAKKELAVSDNSNNACRQTPFSEDAWKVTMAGRTIALGWSSERCELTEDAKELEALRKYVHQLVEGKEAYKLLPAAEGGYD